MRHVLISLAYYDRPLHEGIVRYAAEHDWQLNTELIRKMGRLPTQWSGDGIIAYFGGPPEVKKLISSGKFPVVLVQDSDPMEPYISVSTDTAATVKTAFEFFRRKGFQHFGCYGGPYSERLQMFTAVAESQGYGCRRLHDNIADLEGEAARIREWLQSGPLPLAVYCNNDDLGALFINLAIEAGYNVPDEVAVLGTDNSALVCTSCRVHLSSIDTNLFMVGYRAAEQLDNLLQGKKPNKRVTLTSPKGIVERASTDTIGATSPHVRRAIAIMEADYEKNISVSDIVADIGISSTGLEKAFKRELGYTPGVALRNVRMKVAAQLLATTDEKVYVVASRVGMTNPDYFHTAFKHHFGVTPRKYRLKAKET